MTGRTLGIDLGSAGALALLENASLLDIEDMPVLRDGPNSRPTVNGALLAAIMRRWNPNRAFIEFVAARPTDSKVGAFAFGRSRGCVEGVMAAFSIPVIWLTVPTWRRAVGLAPGASKDAARSSVIQRWPNHAEKFARARDDGRAEAALIGIAGLMRQGGDA
jgi:crossover junction endodeoxyribonuclease RuvC